MDWHPACTGCLPLTHILGAPNSWHCCCTAFLQVATCSHTRGLNTADPQKISLTKAQGEPSTSISTPRCIRSPLAVTWDKGQAPSPAKWLNCFKKKTVLKNLDQEWGTHRVLSDGRLQPLVVRTGDRTRLAN